MALATGNYFRVQLKGIQAGELTYTNVEYYPVGAELTTFDLFLMTSDWINQVLTPTLDILSNRWTSIAVTGRRRGITLNDQDMDIPYSVAGVVDDDCLPVYNTWSFAKVPDNSTVAPTADYVFKHGRIALSGIPESWQLNGQAASLRLGELADVAEAWHEFTHSGGAFPVMRLRMDNRKPGGTGLRRAVSIDNVFFNRLGTQLTRKS